VAILRRQKSSTGRQLIAHLNRTQFERQLHTSGVQELITRARKSWLARYGVDPAAERFKDPR
jgi:hypothetical protein